MTGIESPPVVLFEGLVPMVLQVREITSGVSTPHLLVTAGVHGDEFEPMFAVRRLIEMFDQPDGSATLLRGRLTLVPVVHKSAFSCGTRTGGDGLDLARVCPGDPTGSISERVAASLSQLIRGADHYIDLHAGGSANSVFPLAGYTLHTDREVLATQRRMARAFNLPVVWGTSPELNGRSLSVARDAGVPAIYCEHHGSGQCNPVAVADYVEGCLNVMAELGMLSRPQPEPRVRLTVEDPRPGSGHLQVCNPAPTAGLFQPAVALGDEIGAGDMLGDVVDPFTGERHPVASGHGGLVIVLRTFPRVLKGDSVGVVLERSGENSWGNDGNSASNS